MILLNQNIWETLKDTSRLHFEIMINTEHGKKEFAVGEICLSTSKWLLTDRPPAVQDFGVVVWTSATADLGPVI
jgi:hypothetical protein